MNSNQIIPLFTMLCGQITNFLKILISLGLVILLFGAVLKAMQFHVPYLPTIAEMQLAYLCGAWWLISR